MDYNWSPYAVGGAAARPDSFTGLNPAFASGVYGMVQAAHDAGVPLQITSAYRSPDLQAQLYDAAVKKYGSPEAARKWVAPPGKSQHNFGTAVDFAIDGSLIRDANSPAAKWIAQNASKYGLSVPMDWEPWQVEMAGARGGNQRMMFGGPQAETSGILPPSPDQLDMGTPEGTPEETNFGILANIGKEITQASQPQNQPVQFAPRPQAQIQPAQRDPMAAYLQFIQSMGA